MQYHAECIFPNLIHVVESEVDTAIKDYCLNKKLQDPTGVFLSNCGGWQSEAEAEGVITDKLYELIQPIQQHFTRKLEIANSWININPTGSFNNKHFHPQCDLAGVYYVDVPENSGDLVFESPQSFHCYSEIESYTPAIKEEWGQHLERSITPMKGLLIMFPSYLTHGVLPNQSKEDRISISFNTRVIG